MTLTETFEDRLRSDSHRLFRGSVVGRADTEIRRTTENQVFCILNWFRATGANTEANIFMLLKRSKFKFIGFKILAKLIRSKSNCETTPLVHMQNASFLVGVFYND